VTPEPAAASAAASALRARVRVWAQGARPKTLGAAISPVLAGTAAATLDGPLQWWRAAGALTVALALQVGVNFANDYSDGVRGADAQRRGPLRLTASGLATPRAVRNAAVCSFAVAAAAGAALSLAVEPWLLAVGAAALLAAVTYTGGPKPYGYAGFGEVVVLVFFGFVATVGSAYVQHASLPGVVWPAALAIGLPACAILLANNVRDVDTDRAAGKLTLAVRLGERRARVLHVACLAGALAATVVAAIFVPAALAGLAAAPLAVGPARAILTRHDLPGLVAALLGTARFQLVLASLLAGGLWAG
jgi:1,4-dihydroxy-2-naphthoate octaprenyltransferase